MCLYWYIMFILYYDYTILLVSETSPTLAITVKIEMVRNQTIFFYFTTSPPLISPLISPIFSPLLFCSLLSHFLLLFFSFFHLLFFSFSFPPLFGFLNLVSFDLFFLFLFFVVLLECMIDALAMLFVIIISLQANKK